MSKLRLDPSIPMMTPKGKGRAIIVWDPGEDQHLQWTVAIDATGELWTFQNPEVRVRANRTLRTDMKFPLDTAEKED